MKFPAVAAALLCLASQAHASEALIGNWKLVSFYTEDSKTGQRTDTYGAHPTGAIGFTPGGRFYAFATAEGRKPAQSVDDQAAAFRTVIAYTGKWHTEGETFVTDVDVAWNPAWVGTRQVRFWRLQDGRLHITTAPLPNPNVPGSTLIGTLVWEREN